MKPQITSYCVFKWQALPFPIHEDLHKVFADNKNKYCLKEAFLKNENAIFYSYPKIK